MIHYIDGFAGREIDVHGKKYLYFGGTSYLGLQADTEFQQNYIANVKKYGTNYGASRKSNLRLEVFDKAEELLANFVGCEAALSLSSGYLAGQFIAQHFNKSEYRLFYAPNTHSALYNNYNKPYSSFTDLDNAIRQHLSTDSEITPVVFMDSIDFEGCNYPNFDGLNHIPLDKTILVVDDSHGIGIVGKNGNGVYNTVKQFNAKELVVCCSLGKSFGIQAGAVLGDSNRIEQLERSAFFGGASPAAPSGIATFIDSQAIYRLKRKQLQSNIELFKSQIQDIGFFSSMFQHPAFTFQELPLSNHLEEKGIILTNFNYPEESSALMSRIVISSHHKKDDITLLANAINDYKSN